MDGHAQPNALDFDVVLTRLCDHSDAFYLFQAHCDPALIGSKSLENMIARPPHLSVIVPTYFGGDDLKKCVRAIAAQLAPDDELIVVADGESDRAWADLGVPDVQTVVLPVRRGPAFARNRGAEVARGDVLLFIDADCIAHPDVLARVRRAFENDVSLAAAIGSYDDAPAHPAFLSQYRNLLHHYVHQRSRDEVHTFWAGCGAIRSEAFFAAGGFDERYEWPCVEDIDLGYRLTERRFRIRILKDLQVQHLKAWTTSNILRTDLLLRAAPWTELILRYRTLEDNLNTSVRTRISVAAVATSLVLAPCVLVALVGGLVGVAALALLGSLAAAGAALAFNQPFYRFLREKRGRRFALRAMPWYLVYLVCAGAGAFLGLLRFTLRAPPPARLTTTRRASASSITALAQAA